MAAATFYLKFPSTQYVDLPEGIAGKGVPGLVDVPEFQAFFEWRDRLYSEFRTTRPQGPTPAGAASGPTPISID